MTEAPKVEQGIADQLSQALVNRDVGRFNAVAFVYRHEIIATLTEPERTAKAVAEAVAAERERCARIADNVATKSRLVLDEHDARLRHEGIVSGAAVIATAIRDEGTGGNA